MTQILDISGKPAGPANTATKKAHDPEEAKRDMARLQSMFKGMMDDFVRDVDQPSEFPELREVDMQAVIDHYDAKWREAMRVRNESSMPHKGNPEALKLEMERITNDARLMMLARKPLSKIADLSEYNLNPLGHCQYGMLYMNSRVAVAIDGHGNTTVWLRAANEPLQLWCSGWAPQPDRLPTVEAPHYTAGELNNLLAVTRCPNVSMLDEQWMQMARTGEAAARKPWYKRWF